MKTATSTTLLALAMTAAARPFVPILARMPARLPTEYYARDAAASLPELAAQAQELNAKFDGLRLADACSSGEKACVQGTSATCVDGAWAGDDCPNGMRCFALPDLSQGAVVLTCTSKTDAKSRIDAAAQAGPAVEEAADATATEDGECPDETDAPLSTGAAAPSSDAAAPTSTAAPAGAGGADDGDDEDCPDETDAPLSTGAAAPSSDAAAPTSTAAPAGAGGADDGDDKDCPAENDSGTDAGNDADGDSCEDDNDGEPDAPVTPTVVAPESSTGLPVATAPASSTDAPLPTTTDAPGASTDAPLPTTTDAPLPPATTPAPEPEPIETVTSVVIILPPQTLGASATTTTLTPEEASAVLSSLGLSTGLQTSTTLIQPSQTGLPAATQTGAPVDGGYDDEYPASNTVTTSAPASTATAADDGDFITPILPVPGASESSATVSGAPPAVTIS